MENNTKKIKVELVDKKSSEECLKDLTIEILNNDCLLQIFEYLPISDRIRLERVNRRWRSVSLASWRSFKTLSFARDTWGYFNRMQVTSCILNNVLDRCSKFITHLDTSDCKILVNKIDVGDILERCYNLTSVNFALFKLNSELLGMLIMSCRKITEFCIGCSSYAVGDRLIERTVLSSYQNLKTLKFKNHKVTGWCLRSVTQHLEELCLKNCYRLDLTYIRNVVPSLQNLRTLSLQGSLNYCFESSYLNFLNLTNIKVLDISNNSKYVNDTCLIAIADSCKNLQSLDLSHNYKVTDEGLIAIASYNLEYLHINFLWHVTGAGLTDMPSLKTLSCRDCYKLDGNLLEPILQTLKKLEHLDLSNCSKISKDLIETAKRSVVTKLTDVSIVSTCSKQLNFIDSYFEVS